MEPNTVVQHLVPSLIWPMLAAGLGTVAALVAGALLVQRKRVPAVLAAGSLGLPIAVTLGAALTASGDVREVAAVVVGQRLVLPLFVGLPAAVALLLAAGAGALRPPRRAVPAVLGAVLALAAAGIVAWGGYAVEETTFTLVRAVVYAVAGVLVALALLAGDAEEGAGPEGAGLAGVAFPLLVAVGEVSGRAMGELQALVGLGGIAPEQRAEVATRFYAELIDAQVPYMWAAFGVASLVALVGVAASAKAPTRLAGSAAGLLWVGLGAALIAVGHPTPERLIAAADAETAEEPAVAAP